MSERPTRPTDLVLEIVGGAIVCGIAAGAVALFDAHPLAVSVTLAMPLLAGGIWLLKSWKVGIWGSARLIGLALAITALVVVNVLIYCDCR